MHLKFVENFNRWEGCKKETCTCSSLTAVNCLLNQPPKEGGSVDLEKKKLYESIIHIASEGGFETLRDLIPLLAQRKQMCAEGRRHNVNDDYIADQLKVYNDKIKYILNL